MSNQPQPITLSKMQDEFYIHNLWNRWQEIAYEALVAMEQETGEAHMPAEEVREVIADYACGLPGWRDLSDEQRAQLLECAIPNDQSI